MSAQAPERNAAGNALHKLQIGLMMMQVGRTEMAGDAFMDAIHRLETLEKELDAKK